MGNFIKNEGTWYNVLSHYDAEDYTAPRKFKEQWHGRHIVYYQRDSGDERNVAYLIWNSERVIVNWNWLESRWYGNNPVLLANLFISLPIIWLEEFSLNYLR